MIKTAVIVDLDSTLCHTAHRHHMIKRENEASEKTDWNAYSMACINDSPIQGVVELVRLLGKQHSILIVSGRSECARAATQDWMYEHSIDYNGMFLRPEGETRLNEDWKLTVIEEIKSRGYEIILALDDWPPVAEAYEKIGIPTVVVNPCYESSQLMRHSDSTV